MSEKVVFTFNAGAYGIDEDGDFFEMISGKWRRNAIRPDRMIGRELARLAGELERERVQHAACLMFAEGSKEECERGSYGWSLANETVKKLRAKHDTLAERVKELEEAQTTAFEDGWAAHAKTSEACEATNAKLRAALEKYGQHRSSCKALELRERVKVGGPDCTCGLRAALEVPSED